MFSDPFAKKFVFLVFVSVSPCQFILAMSGVIVFFIYVVVFVLICVYYVCIGIAIDK